MKTCTKCGESKPLFDFYKDKRVICGLRPDCKVCGKIADRLRRAENPEKANVKSRKWYYANPEKEKARAKRWRQANPDKANALKAKRRASKLQATPPWLTQDDLAGIRQFYTIANQLTELNGQIYHVDHIVPLQGKTVCGLHVPWNLQVLEGSENMSKSNKLVDSCV